MSSLGKEKAGAHKKKSLTRTSQRWQQVPGSFDALHAGQLFPSDNRWGIPVLQSQAVCVPDWLVPYRQKIRCTDTLDDGAVHFFLDDYRFESVWNRPKKGLQALHPYATVLTPDFSLYRDWPLTLQLWNTYRNRWCGCLWQSEGFCVIPTVSWSSAESYAFCFAGIPQRSVVAVGSVGVNFSDPLTESLFVSGFQEMLKQLEPRVVLSYGPLPERCHDLAGQVSAPNSAEIRTYPTRWTNIRAARQNKTMRSFVLER